MSIKSTPRLYPRLEKFLGQSKMNFEKYFFSSLGSTPTGKNHSERLWNRRYSD